MQNYRLDWDNGKWRRFTPYRWRGTYYHYNNYNDWIEYYMICQDSYAHWAGCLKTHRQRSGWQGNCRCERYPRYYDVNGSLMGIYGRRGGYVDWFGFLVNTCDHGWYSVSNIRFSTDAWLTLGYYSNSVQIYMNQYWAYGTYIWWQRVYYSFHGCGPTQFHCYFWGS